MSLKKKCTISFLLCFVCYLLIPFLAVTFAGMAGMSICFILFFAADPLVCAIVGVITGTQVKRLWWLPVTAAAAMPLCFSLCVRGFVSELFIYSGFYVIIGLIAMGITCVITKRIGCK